MEPVDSSSAPITELLQRAQAGNQQAREYLFQAVFAHLRRIAAANLRNERSRRELQPTELVNEAYIHLFGERLRTFQNRMHFLAVAASAMRCVLIDLARKRGAIKRTGKLQQVTLNELIPSSDQPWPEKLLALDQLLRRLADFDPRAAEIVELKVFLGCTDDEAAEVVGRSPRTVKRDYKAARTWLEAELAAGRGAARGSAG